MQAEREWAERYLRNRCLFGSWGPGPLQRSQSREGINAERRARFEAAADALSAVGVVGDGEVERFRRRLEDEIARGPDPEPAPWAADDELARRARLLLESRLTNVARGAVEPGAAADADSHREAVSQFTRVEVACAACGALSSDELARWHERLREVDGGHTWWLERERREKRCSLTELRAVVPGDTTRKRGVRIISAELYAEGVLLRWHSENGMVPQLVGDRSGSGDGAYPPAPVSLTDDLATEYLHLHTGQSARSAGGPVIGTSTFATAVPEQAVELVAEIWEERLVVALTAEAGS